MNQVNQPYAPNGWVIDIYKYLTIPPSDFDPTKKIFGEAIGRNNDKVRSGTKEIAYGNYDRIQLRAVNCFSDYSSLSSQAYDWFGTSQSIFIYPLEEDTKKRPFLWAAHEKVGKLNIRYDDGKVSPPEGFFATTFCYISDEARSIRAGDYTALLQQCKTRLERLTAAYNQFWEQQVTECKEAGQPTHHQITAEFFGSFSSAEVVILWSAEQYTDILYLSDCIRDICIWQDIAQEEPAFSLFRSTYTMVSSPHIDFASVDGSLTEVRGEAYVQLAVQEGIGIDKIKKLRRYIKRALQHAADETQDQEKPPKPYSRDCAGEYDIIFRTKSRYLPALFGNQKDWHTVENDDDRPTLNIHSREFNQYVLHTTTRLCYAEGDLPGFAQSNGKLFGAWEREKRSICKVILEQDAKEDGLPFSRTWRSSLIQELMNSQKTIFEDLIGETRERFPAISGLFAELNQLFSDYIQCCSTSADYLWIQDYHELFQQTMLMLKRVVSYIPVRAEQETLGRDVQSHLEDINRLMNALQQQTNHILASSKLFFKEQNVRFGYTAQHDLVIHAYYGIIKRLMEIIYQNSNPQVQSKLYPLVNFRPENVLCSEMYMEDSSAEFKKLQKLSNRIVVICMPLDGMNNIMHYLPMMIHELFHYSAPVDRNGRNKLLAQIAVYQLLKEIWIDFFHQALAKLWENKKEPRDEYQESLISGSAEHIFLSEIEQALYRLIDKRGESIYYGIQRHSFVEPSAPVLRSWFKDALEAWLLGESGNSEDMAAGDLPSFSDLLEAVFVAVTDSLQKKQSRLLHRGATVPLEPGEEIFCLVTTALLKQAKSDDIYQELMEKADLLYHTDVTERFLEQLDEVFPDYAMVALTNMPVSGYLLQIALNLDMQFNSPLQTVNLRFGMLLHWLLSQQSKPGTRFLDALETELSKFEELYCTAYQMSTAAHESDVKQIRKEAQDWSDYYRKMYSTYESDGQQLSFSAIQPWLTHLIQAHMLPALQVSEEIKEPFVEAYRSYLEALQMPEGQERQDKMFHASMQTILRFQSRRTVKSINAEFTQKSTATPAPKLEPPRVFAIPEHPGLRCYEFRAFGFDHIHQLIAQALERLYWYRKKECCPDFTGMWYRGVQNKEYAILPSGFVHFSEDANRIIGQCDEGKADYLPCLRHLYEVFRYSEEGTGEQVNPAVYTMVDHLALMQHYSQHTNLLDWSEDAYTSLYFALEDEITINDKYAPEQTKPGNFPNAQADAALYILDPVRFNRACEEMEVRLGFLPRAAMPPMKYKHTREVIPNLSIRQNRAPFREYHDVYQSPKPDKKCWLTINRLADSPRDVCLTLSDIPKGKLRGHLPRAVYTSKLNPRIKAQSGLFVAFSMLSQPAKWSGETVRTEGPNQSLFYYQSLEALQEFYLTEDGKCPFLFKIIIPNGLRKSAGRALYRFGMSKEKIYPELDNRRSR